MGTPLQLLSVTLCLLLGFLFITSYDKDQTTSSSTLTLSLTLTLPNLHRRLSFADPKTVQVKRNNNRSPLYDTSCPLAISNYHDVPTDGAAEARYVAQNSGAFESLQAAIRSGSFDHRKIVIAGDSTVRQMFSSMSCHAYTAGLWESKDSFLMGLYQKNLYYDARVKLAGGGELIYTPLAGSINNFWANGVARDMSKRPMESGEDWIRDCKQGKPFFLHTYKEYTQTTGPYFVQFTDDNPHLEKVRLGKNDIVFMNSGHHTEARGVNMSKTKALLKCMENQYAKGINIEWPSIYYIRTTPQHFPSKTGEYSKHLEDGCIHDIHVDVSLIEEHKMFPKMQLVAENLNLKEGGIGRMHMGGRDCTHFAMPGVPSLFIPEIVKTIQHTH